MLAKVYGSAVFGIEATTVVVEVNIDNGIGYHLVGLPDSAIKESNYRIAAALLNNGRRIPGKKITINMAPADLRKEGAAYDLCLALGILSASGQEVFPDLDRYMIMGELSLDGSLQPIRGALPIALAARREGFAGLILPADNAREAGVVKDLKVYGAHNLGEVLRFLSGNGGLLAESVPGFGYKRDRGGDQADFRDVRGQESAKRCLEIAAAGGHNLILVGPPGAGKTMLAKRLGGILPPMSLEEALETTKIHSVALGKRLGGLIEERPFRSPHHTISNVAMVGGGSYPQPGEISLAHNGVLFLDELPEFKRHVLEVMRQPLEDREVTISRAQFTVTYPSSFMLVASMNPSPGGYFQSDRAVEGSRKEMRRYMGRISGPLLDRIDMHMEVSPVPFEKLSDDRKGEGSLEIRNRVTAAREIQTKRFTANTGVHYNAQMATRDIRKYCPLNDGSARLLKNAMKKLSLSARAYDRILKVSRTIADLDGREVVGAEQIAEAIQYRALDREGWLF